jgi:hypothetical protein
MNSGVHQFVLRKSAQMTTRIAAAMTLRVSVQMTVMCVRHVRMRVP